MGDAIPNAAAHGSYTVRLLEHGTVAVDRSAFQQATGVELSAAQAQLDPLVSVRGSDDPARLLVEADRRVGAISLGRLRVIVQPRLSATRLGSLIRFALARDYATSTAPNVGANTGLDELIGRLLASELAAIRQAGVARRYVERADRLDVIRGRVDFTRSLPWNDCSMTSVACRFHELTADNLDNRLVRAALERATSLDLERDTRASLLDHRLTWRTMAADTAATRPQFDQARLAYTRLTKHYALAHVLSQLIVEGTSVDAPREDGPIATSGLILDMAELFELAVARVLEVLCEDRGWRASRQRNDACAIVNATGRLYRRIRPDVEIFEGPTPVAIADAKYKDYWRDDRRIGNDDLYQLFFYAQRAQTRFEAAAPPRAVIIAPFPDEEERGSATTVRAENRVVRLRAAENGELRLDLLLLPLGSLLDRLLASGDVHAAVHSATAAWDLPAGPYSH